MELTARDIKNSEKTCPNFSYTTNQQGRSQTGSAWWEETKRTTMLVHASVNPVMLTNQKIYAECNNCQDLIFDLCKWYQRHQSWGCSTWLHGHLCGKVMTSSCWFPNWFHEHLTGWGFPIQSLSCTKMHVGRSLYDLPAAVVWFKHHNMSTNFNKTLQHQTWKFIRWFSTCYMQTDRP
jgi:hypothetical protein